MVPYMATSHVTSINSPTHRNTLYTPLDGVSTRRSVRNTYRILIVYQSLFAYMVYLLLQQTLHLVPYRRQTYIRTAYKMDYTV